jgi:hypothetical protein
MGLMNMGTIANIQFQKNLIEQFCIKYHIGRLSFFGSVLRQDFRPDSDVDVLVEFQPGRRGGVKSIHRHFVKHTRKSPGWLS